MEEVATQAMLVTCAVEEPFDSPLYENKKACDEQEKEDAAAGSSSIRLGNGDDMHAYLKFCEEMCADTIGNPFDPADNVYAFFPSPLREVCMKDVNNYHVITLRNMINWRRMHPDDRLNKRGFRAPCTEQWHVKKALPEIFKSKDMPARIEVVTMCTHLVMTLLRKLRQIENDIPRRFPVS